MDTTIIYDTPLTGLRSIFVDAGFDLWIVGGACRDLMLDKSPKDIDLTTSATPAEQIAIYDAHGIQYIPTGLQHGTITVILDQPYEITSMRTESEHDGRYAQMRFTRDLHEDLSRRDLTINAMALDFSGNLIDPFGGQADLEAGRVRFVGNAEERMNEDFLRILRFFRFHARIAGDSPLCEEAEEGIRQARGGLLGISVERIWSEMSRIISGPAADATLDRMRELALFEIIGMPIGPTSSVMICSDNGVSDPAAIMGVYVTTPKQIDWIANNWKWSSAERRRAQFMSSNRETGLAEWKAMLVDGVSYEWVADLIALSGENRDLLKNWDIPTFPVTGRDLIARGVKPGPEMGAMLDAMTLLWKTSDYTMSRDDLLSV